MQQLLELLGGDITLIFWAAGAAQQVFFFTWAGKQFYDLSEVQR